MKYIKAFFRNCSIAFKGHFGIGRPDDDKYCHCYCYFGLPCTVGWKTAANMLWWDLKEIPCKLRGKHWDVADPMHLDELEKGYVWCKICNRVERTTELTPEEIQKFNEKYPWFEESLKILNKQ